MKGKSDARTRSGLRRAGWMERKDGVKVQQKLDLQRVLAFRDDILCLSLERSNQQN
jgi:hypothetical protein